MRIRTLCVVAGLMAGVGLWSTGCHSAGSGRSDVMTPERQRSMTPDMVLAELKAGNERFVRNQSTEQHWLAQAEATATAQFPKAIVLGCLDSRVPPEVVFDQGIGDIFVGRVAGNFANEDLIGSMEFGTKLVGARLIVVLGHTQCGAVMGAIDGAEMGNLTQTLSNIKPAIAEVSYTRGERTSSNEDFVMRVTEANVRRTVREIEQRSQVISDLVRQGDLRIVGAVYELETGRVRWLDL